MSYLGNTPGKATVLQLEARKSFSLGVWVKEPRGKAVDLAGCTLTIVAKKLPLTTADDSTNLLAPDAAANIPVPAAGYAVFHLQAATLDEEPGEYPFAIVLRTADGYSSVIVKGVLDIQQNTEFASTASTYSSANPPQSLTVLLREQNAINVFVGGQLPPGMNYVDDETAEAINEFDPEAVALVPRGGLPGYVLTKVTEADYAMGWRPREHSEGGLDATGQPGGAVPVALGDGTWDWDEVGIDATGIPEGYAPVADGNGGWAWAEVETDVVIPAPNWAAAPGTPGAIQNKPVLGTAAAADTAAFMPANKLVSTMPGVNFVTSIPTSGIDGHLYFVYVP